MDDDVALIPGAHRPVRRLAGIDTAIAGELVTDGERLHVRVPAEDVPDPLWHFGAAEHVAGVRDVARRRDGQDALLPWCTTAVDAFLGRRSAAERPLTSGEVVTLVGSLLRGTLELAGSEVLGRWWLADDGRPLFVPGEGTTGTGAAAGVIDRIRDTCTDRMLERVLAGIRTGVEDHRIVARSIERWERELTELAAPRALQLDVFAPERVEQLAVRRSGPALEAAQLGEQRGSPSRLRGWIGALLDGIRDHTPAVRALPTALRSDRRTRPPLVTRPAPAASGARTRPATAGRGRMLLVGASVAGAVLLGGMMWPGEGEDPSAAGEVMPVRGPASAPGTTATTHPSATPVASTGTAPEAGADGSIAQRVHGLLAAVTACHADGDEKCAHAVMPGAAEVVLQRLAPGAEDRTVTPVEDYGDIAVVRLGPARDAGEQMLVLVTRKDGWLVRDVYDVADQPSGG